MKQYYVYILSNKTATVIYIGVTGDLRKRVWQHKSKEIDGFTKEYNVDRLVYYEDTTDIKRALEREKQLKKWNREWKDNLIKEKNSDWKDLYNDLA